MRHLYPLLFALIASAWISGCGYGFQGAGSVLPPDVQRVYVPLVENDTTESGLAIVITEALRDRFDRYGVVTVVDSLNTADAVLNVKVLSLRRQTRSVSANDTALQYDLVLTLGGELRRVTGPLLWRGTGVRAIQTVGSTSDVVVTSSPGFAAGSIAASDLGQLDSLEVNRGQEQEALLELADVAARRVYESAVTPDF